MVQQLLLARAARLALPRTRCRLQLLYSAPLRAKHTRAHVTYGKDALTQNDEDVPLKEFLSSQQQRLEAEEERERTRGVNGRKRKAGHANFQSKFSKDERSGVWGKDVSSSENHSSTAPRFDGGKNLKKKGMKKINMEEKDLQEMDLEVVDMEKMETNDQSDMANPDENYEGFSDTEFERMLEEAKTLTVAELNMEGPPQDEMGDAVASTNTVTEGTTESEPVEKSDRDDLEGAFEKLFAHRLLTEDMTIEEPSRDRTKMVRPFGESARRAAQNFGFLFDCDGVLYCGNQKIRDAMPALRAVKWHFARYLFLTNSGGLDIEAHRADDLKKRMGFSKKEKMFTKRVIQSSSPFDAWTKEQKEKDVIYITSRNPRKARTVAEFYGFKNVVIATDIVDTWQHIYPFEAKLMNRKTKKLSKTLPGNTKLFKSEEPEVWEEAKLKQQRIMKIDHIFIWNDPRDWSLETQIIHDLLTSHRGYLGTQSKKNGDKSLPNNGWQQDGQPKVWVSNMDLLWKAEYHLNRFGTGAFVEAFKGVWNATTDNAELDFKFMGKPSKETYDYTHKRMLTNYSDAAIHLNLKTKRYSQPLKRVYMIGDNPESDVKGALDYKPEDGTEYVPILVRTGVWKETKHERVPRHKPAVIVDNVLDAVVWAFRNEGINLNADELRRNKKLGGLAGY